MRKVTENGRDWWVSRDDKWFATEDMCTKYEEDLTKVPGDRFNVSDGKYINLFTGCLGWKDYEYDEYNFDIYILLSACAPYNPQKHEEEVQEIVWKIVTDKKYMDEEAEELIKEKINDALEDDVVLHVCIAERIFKDEGGYAI